MYSTHSHAVYAECRPNAPVQPAPARTDCTCDESFQLLLEPHLEMLHAIARRIVSSPDLACDAVQETSLALWLCAEAPTDLRGWLVRTTVHKCLHVLRRAERRGRHEERAGVERNASCPLCDPADSLAEYELKSRLETAIADLSDELRTTFSLRSDRGLEYEEIARELSVPVGTVRSRLARARASIQGRLEEWVEV